MKPIVTLTLNPTIDGSASTDVIAPIRKIRTSDERYHPGSGTSDTMELLANVEGRFLDQAGN